MVELSGAELDFYQEVRKIRVCLDNGEEYTGFVQGYSIINPPSEKGSLRVGDLPSEEFERKRHRGFSTGNSCVIPLGNIKKLEAAAIKEIENVLGGITLKEVISFLR